MKNNIIKLVVFLLILLSGVCLLHAESQDGSKHFDTDSYHSAGNIGLRVSNYGILGSDDYSISPSLEYPLGSGINYLNRGALWIGGKKPRRNEDGELLYWLALNPQSSPPDSARVITQDDPLWNSSKKTVIDTLTSVAFDGDMDLFELLPAYNPLMSSNTNISELYSAYNTQDKVLLSITGNPSPRPFEIPDPLGTYCFTIPSDIPDDNPGYETLTSFYYDYCPLGTTGDRDWGGNRGNNRHCPLGLAIEQQSYAWPLQDYGDEIIIKYIIRNTSTIDTLYDVNIGMFMDVSCGPSSWGSVAENDDVCGYCPGEGYEFAYAHDEDGDDGLTTGVVGTKIKIPNRNLNYASWFWRLGDGPDDSDPLELQPSYLPHATANEKYWLMAGRNPSTFRFVNLRPDGNSDFGMPSPGDTRFMLSYYGAQPGTTEYDDPQNRLCIAPNSNLVIYVAIMAGTDLIDLKQTAQSVENLIDSNITIQVDPDSPSMPLLQNVQQTAINSVDLKWFSYTNPRQFQIMYKLAEAPASTWRAIDINGSFRTCGVDFLTNGLTYKFKVAAIFFVNGNEVYLESSAQTLTINNDDPSVIVQNPVLETYPNPFSSEMKIRMKGFENQPRAIAVYNIKGQKVKIIGVSDVNTWSWNGRDDNGERVGSGVYFIHIHTGGRNLVKKILFLK